MSNLLNLSEATSMAMHAMVYLAASDGQPCTASEVGSSLRMSEAHLSKVLQRLGKAGLVRSVRGPGGGYVLARPAEEIALLDIYQAMEGPFKPADCLMGSPVCRGRGCILGGLIGTLNRETRAYLSRTRISQLTGVYGRLRGRPRASASGPRQSVEGTRP